LIRTEKKIKITKASMATVEPVRTKSGRILGPHKAILSARFDARTVLTAAPWEFVSLWLKREKQNDALVLWNQAREFYEVSSSVSLQAAPLLHYYAFMNAAKALLTAKGITYDIYHGVRADDLRGSSRRITLSNEGIAIKQTGVLPALSQYLGETERSTKHTLKEILFNLPFVHRTYCLTYENQRDMFVPLTSCRFVVDSASAESYFSANISEDFSLPDIGKRLPSTLILNPTFGTQAVRSKGSVLLSSAQHLASADFAKLANLNRSLRDDLHYINATQTLWYAKLKVRGPKRLSRFPLTLTLAAMHRLSEICRYRPLELVKFGESQENWLLSEFVQAAPRQFLDAIASELTGYQFLLPNVRPAS
jgi:hypothetical protein